MSATMVLTSAQSLAAPLDDSILDDAMAIDNVVPCDAIISENILLGAPDVFGATIIQQKDELPEEKKKSPISTKLIRAIRFGLPTVCATPSSAALGSDEAKALRAQRFGITPTNTPTQIATPKFTKRFGHKSTQKENRIAKVRGSVKKAIQQRKTTPKRKMTPKMAPEAKKARLSVQAKRFGGALGDATEIEAKKKARLQRFSL